MKKIKLFRCRLESAQLLSNTFERILFCSETYFVKVQFNIRTECLNFRDKNSVACEEKIEIRARYLVSRFCLRLPVRFCTLRVAAGVGMTDRQTHCGEATLLRESERVRSHCAASAAAGMGKDVMCRALLMVRDGNVVFKHQRPQHVLLLSAKIPSYFL